MSDFRNKSAKVRDPHARAALLALANATEAADIASLTDSSGGTANSTIAAVTLAAALTHAVGTADATVDDVSGAFDQTILNNNFKEVTTALASDRAAISALRDAVADLAAKVNAILAALR